LPNTSIPCPISVIIPVFNRQSLGVRAVLSACAQGVDGLEIIVVDDGSRPPFQLRAVDRPECVRVIRLPGNSGASAARNAGIAAARGEWIALLDSDDYWVASTLAQRLYAAQKLAQAANKSPLAFAAGFVLKKRPNDFTDVRIPRAAHDPDEFASGCWFAPGSTILFRRELFERVGPWDTQLARLEDYDWFLRFALAGGRLCVWDSVAAVIEVEGKPTANVLQAAADRLLAKYANKTGSHALSATGARRLKAFIDVEWASLYWAQGEPALTLFYLGRSFLRHPRLTLHLRQFWNIAPRQCAESS
jgi:glycosyltransferase involved in cell wall biosynthesis